MFHIKVHIKSETIITHTGTGTGLRTHKHIHRPDYKDDEVLCLCLGMRKDIQKT